MKIKSEEQDSLSACTCYLPNLACGDAFSRQDICPLAIDKRLERFRLALSQIANKYSVKCFVLMARDTSGQSFNFHTGQISISPIGVLSRAVLCEGQWETAMDCAVLHLEEQSHIAELLKQEVACQGVLKALNALRKAACKGNNIGSMQQRRVDAMLIRAMYCFANIFQVSFAS